MISFLIDCDAFVRADVYAGFAVAAFVRVVDGQFAVL